MRKCQKLLAVQATGLFGRHVNRADIERIRSRDFRDAGDTLRHGSGTRDILAANRSIDRVLEGRVLVAIVIDALQGLLASLGEFGDADLILLRLLAGCDRDRVIRRRVGAKRAGILPVRTEAILAIAGRDLDLAPRHLEAVRPFLQVLPEGEIVIARYFARFSGVKRKGKLCIWMAFWPPEKLSRASA